MPDCKAFESSFLPIFRSYFCKEIHSLLKGKGFFFASAILCIKCYLRLVQQPFDPLHVFSTLLHRDFDSGLKSGQITPHSFIATWLGVLILPPLLFSQVKHRGCTNVLATATTIVTTTSAIIAPFGDADLMASTVRVAVSFRSSMQDYALFSNWTPHLRILRFNGVLSLFLRLDYGRLAAGSPSLLHAYRKYTSRFISSIGGCSVL